MPWGGREMQVHACASCMCMHVSLSARANLWAAHFS